MKDYDAEGKMTKKANEFKDVYKRYFNGDIDDEEMTEYVTQPFWNSLHISKKRLDNVGLNMDIDINIASKKT